MKTKLSLLLAITSLVGIGCGSLERAPLAGVPLPETTHYDNDETARGKYREGFKQGYTDYLKGESSVSTSFRYRSPDARLHGYSDGKMDAMQFVKNSREKDVASGSHKESYHNEQSWSDRYGEAIDSVTKIKWHGGDFKWYGFK